MFGFFKEQKGTQVKDKSFLKRTVRISFCGFKYFIKLDCFQYMAYFFDHNIMKYLKTNVMKNLS